jgi:hypothetical protein
VPLTQDAQSLDFMAKLSLSRAGWGNFYPLIAAFSSSDGTKISRFPHGYFSVEENKAIV